MLESAIKSVENFVREEMEWLCVAHDFLHIERVVNNTQKIQQMEWKWDRDVVTIAALLHESLDEKFFKQKDMDTRKNTIKTLLKSLEIETDKIQQIMFIIGNVGFGKSLNREKDFPYTLEFQIVEDADRLEAMWAINIARTFAYGSKKGQAIYDPEMKPKVMADKDSYYAHTGITTSFNHFYEKLLLLKDMIHTKSWRQLAQPRHDFMVEFMDVFLAEWNNKR